MNIEGFTLVGLENCYTHCYYTRGADGAADCFVLVNGACFIYTVPLLHNDINVHKHIARTAGSEYEPNVFMSLYVEDNNGNCSLKQTFNNTHYDSNTLFRSIITYDRLFTSRSI